MLQAGFIVQNKEQVIKALQKKNFNNAIVIDEIVSLDQKRREGKYELDENLAIQNTISREVGVLFKQGDKEGAENKKAESATVKEQSKKLAETLLQLEQELEAKLVTLPNLPHESVPEGKMPEDNVITKEGGQKPILSEGAEPHWNLIEKYDLVSLGLGTKITGAGFPVYKGRGAKLQRALINFFLDEAQEAGYLEIIPPFVVNRDSAWATGQLPDKEGQMYEVKQEELYLIPTAEVPLTNMYRDVIIAEKELPIKLVAHSPCFRREAGSYGKDVRGLNRVHQFEKVEIVQIQLPEKSYETLEKMVAYVEGLLIKLELPYRILKLCGGDMGFTSALTYDFEVYSAAQKRWLEVSSVSNFETFQSNRMKLRCRAGDKKTKLAHTLNGSALALPRILAAIIENNQTPEGLVVPNILTSYTGFNLIN